MVKSFVERRKARFASLLAFSLANFAGLSHRSAGSVEFTAFFRLHAIKTLDHDYLNASHLESIRSSFEEKNVNVSTNLSTTTPRGPPSVAQGQLAHFLPFTIPTQRL